MHTRQSGFSLIELAVAMFILVLLLGSILVPLGTQVEQRQISETQKTLEQIQEALVGFAVARGYLPCPDKTTSAGAGVAPNAPNDGLEDRTTTGTCVATSEGNVPWVTLGVGNSDVWGNRFRYQVSAAYAQSPPGATFNLSSSATINVCRAAGCPTGTRLTNASPDGAAAIVISLGKNGLGAINANTGTANPTPSSTDENENLNGPNTFVSRTITTADTTAGEFDDVVVWLSKYTLFSRMIAAGRLP